MTAWGFADPAAVATAPVVSDASDPARQRVAYGTVDGHIHVRALETGAEAVAGGVSIVDGALSGERTALDQSGTVVAGDGLIVPHNDGAGVAIARVSVSTGQRIDDDVPLPDSLGCSVAGPPLLTPVADDGTRLLFFTIEGGCGSALVCLAVRADGGLGPTTRTPIAGLASGSSPALVVVGEPPRYVVAVARSGGIDLRAADGMASAGSVELGFTPAALAGPETAGAPTPVLLAVGDRLARLTQSARGDLSVTASADVTGTSLALGGGAEPRIAVGGGSALTVLRSDLTTIGTVSGAVAGVSASGGLAYVARGGRLTAVDLDTLATTDLGEAVTAPALARGYVVTGPGASLTTDVSPPRAVFPEGAAGLSGLSVLGWDDRGVAAVEFRVDGVVVATAPVASPFALQTRYDAAYDPRRLPAGRHRLDAVVRDRTGNEASATRTVRLSCRTRRGTRRADRLHGRKGRDCVRAGRGRDRIDVRRGGADVVRCGPGRDTVRADPFDRVTDDCERIRRR